MQHKKKIHATRATCASLFTTPRHTCLCTTRCCCAMLWPASVRGGFSSTLLRSMRKRAACLSYCIGAFAQTCTCLLTWLTMRSRVCSVSITLSEHALRLCNSLCRICSLRP